ncbi:HAMP domain-containing sensor histidine kinase [Gordonia sp. NPDC003585]|uniref:sensor histidine kinase n=1 Tax=Gordonia sp. NPDC003585 TaxID=3154275 RepID=UPI0033A53DCA
MGDSRCRHTRRRRMGVGSPRWHGTSVRTRLTIVGAGLLTVALAIAGAVVLLVLYRALTSSADAATSTRVAEVAEAVSAAAGIEPALMSHTESIDVVQVIDSTGAVVAASSGDRHEEALVAPLTAGERRTEVDAAFPGSPTEYRVTVQGVATPDGRTLTIVAGAAEGPIHATVWTVFAVLSVVFPIIMVAAVVATNQLVGRTLRPVESIRAEVADISRSGQARRVHVPSTEDEIATLATTMNEMLDALAFAREQQLRFVGDSSHELRSPLVTILGLLELSRRTGEPIDANTVSTLLLPEAFRLRDLVDDMLLLARADEHGLTPDIEEVDLDDLVNDEVARLDLTTDLTITATIVPARLLGDRNQLARVLRNLCDNAARHARTSVDLTMTSDPQVATVAVTDDGPGIPDADRSHVFDRFVRLDPTRSRSAGGTGEGGTGAGGTGLGLSIVDEIVRAHRGTVTVADSDGGGATMMVSLPKPPADHESA